MGIKCEGMTGIGKAILVKDLNDVDQWVDENKLMLNAKKTQLLLLGRKGRAQELEDVSVTLNGEQLLRSRMVKCLGASIDDGLMWKEHVDSLRKKCYCGLAKLRRLRDVLPPETKKSLQCPGAPTFRLLLSGLARVHKRTPTEGRTNPELRDAFNIVQTTSDSQFWPQRNPEVDSIKGKRKTAQDGSGTPMCQQTKSRIHEGCICEQ